MFDGTLGKYTGSEYTIALKEDANPYHTKPFPIPKIHEVTFKKEVNRLIKIGVLKKINNFQWSAPTFMIPKIKSNIDFRFQRTKLNNKKETFSNS